MVENIEPADSYGVTHFPINSLNMTFKFFANQKSDYAYPDKKPKNAAGVQKGPEGAAAFAAERDILRERVETYMKMKIGKCSWQCYQLSPKLHISILNHSVEFQEFSYYLDFTWNQSWQIQSLNICHFSTFGGSIF